MNILIPEYSHSDQRRKLDQLLTLPIDHEIKQVNRYDAKKGSILGNHYHKHTTEYFLITKGTIELKVSRIDNQESLKMILNNGQFFVVYPYEIHTLLCLTDVRLITMLTEPYSHSEPDIYKEIE